MGVYLVVLIVILLVAVCSFYCGYTVGVWRCTKKLEEIWEELKQLKRERDSLYGQKH